MDMSLSEPHTQVALLGGLDPLRETGLGDCWFSVPASMQVAHLVVLRPCACHGRRPALVLITTGYQQDP